MSRFCSLPLPHFLILPYLLLSPPVPLRLIFRLSASVSLSTRPADLFTYSYTASQMFLSLCPPFLTSPIGVCLCLYCLFCLFQPMFACLSACLSVFAWVSIYLIVSLYLSVCLHTLVSIHLPVCLPISASSYLRLYTCRSVSIGLSVSLHISFPRA